MLGRIRVVKRGVEEQVLGKGREVNVGSAMRYEGPKS